MADIFANASTAASNIGSEFIQEVSLTCCWSLLLIFPPLLPMFALCQFFRFITNILRFYHRFIPLRGSCSSLCPLGPSTSGKLMIFQSLTGLRLVNFALL